MQSNRSTSFVVGDDPPAGAVRETLAGVRSAWWAFIVVPVILEVLVASFARLLPDTGHLLALLVPLTILASTSIGCAVVVSYGAVLWLHRRARGGAQGLSRGQYVVVYVGGILLGGELTFALAPAAWIDPLRLDGLRLPFWGVAGVVVVVVAGVQASLDRLRRRAVESDRIARDRERQVLVAELAALQARTQPHFLFNSLSLVATLIEEDPRLASLAVERLSALLRYALRGAQEREVALADEVAAVRDYLELQTMRFNERLRYRIDVDAGLDEALILPLTVQPLVENSVNHAVAARASGASISVRVRRVGNVVAIDVRDDGPGHTDRPGAGTAHRNLNERMTLHHGKQARFEVYAVAGEGYRVLLEFPFRTESDRATRADADRR